jgi:hypothetical protein
VAYYTTGLVGTAVSHATCLLNLSVTSTLYNMTLSASPLSTIALLFLSYVAYRITQSFIVRRRFDAFSKQHGCEEPLNVTGPFPFRAWAFVWRLMWVSPNNQRSIIIPIHTYTHDLQTRQKHR